MEYTTEVIKEMLRSNPNVTIIYFWGHKSDGQSLSKACFSQWYNSEFVVDGIKYHTAEQYMMACKARLFDDEETFASIMQSPSPDQCKKLGRKVHNFDPVIWDAEKFNIVVNGNIAKFSQNEALGAFLLATEDAILVEASPYDTVWGIGLDPETAASSSVDTWRGENLLGCALMETRDWLSGERTTYTTE